MDKCEPYPISIILKNKPIAVVGGGEVAERKISGLLDTGAKITVIAPEVTNKINAWATKKKVVLKRRDFIDHDLRGKFLVFVATDSAVLNKRVSRLARKNRVLVNCVDTPKECDFFVPSFFRRGSLMLAIATGGKIPALAKKIRQDLELKYGEIFADYLEVLAKAREKIYQKSSLSLAQKKALLEKLIESNVLSLLQGGQKKGVAKFVQEFLQKNL